MNYDRVMVACKIIIFPCLLVFYTKCLDRIMSLVKSLKKYKKIKSTASVCFSRKIKHTDNTF